MLQSVNTLLEEHAQLIAMSLKSRVSVYIAQWWYLKLATLSHHHLQIDYFYIEFRKYKMQLAKYQN